jgi:AraC family transcriptional regulator
MDSMSAMNNDSLPMSISVSTSDSFHSFLPAPPPAPSNTKRGRRQDPRFERVLAYIHEFAGEDISVNQLAGMAGLSQFHFLRAFKQVTGQSPHRYLVERRVARAAELLKDPSRSIVDVAFEAGFCSQSHLTAVFHRIMKTTPAAYRVNVLGVRKLPRS